MNAEDAEVSRRTQSRAILRGLRVTSVPPAFANTEDGFRLVFFIC
jgi:hypothetical protein